MRRGVGRIMIAAPASGVGKTSATVGLLAALRRRSLTVAPFKTGPDYVDPALHRAACGASARNLDLFLSDASCVRSLLARGSAEADVAVVEGAMGFFDGVALGDRASAWDVARQTQTPVLLVVDGAHRACSVAAEVAGFSRFRDPSMIAGVILNRTPVALCKRLAPLIEREAGVEVVGCLPSIPEAVFSNRDLGLTMPAETTGFARRVELLADAVESSMGVDRIVSLAGSAPPLEGPAHEASDFVRAASGGPLIAVARDEAFCFAYEETLDALRAAGARISFFSPLVDRAIPHGACGLYLGGGYPELHLAALAGNEGMRRSVREAVLAGMPTIAEGGGYLYLHERVEDASGIAYPTAGALPGSARRVARQSRFGYVELIARAESLVAAAGERVRAHEFHRWASDAEGRAFHAVKPLSTRSWDTGRATASLYAAFPQLYLAGAPRIARRFAQAAASWAAQ